MRLTLETILDKGLDDGEQRRLKVSAMRVIHQILNKWGNKPEVIALLDLTSTFDFD